MVKINFKLTPNRILGFSVGLLLVCLVCLLYVLHTNNFLKQTVQTVGKDTVPSIVAAEQIKINISDANAYVINAFLEKEKGNGKNRKIYHQDMAKVSDELVSASQNITYGDEEKNPILTVSKNINEYQYLLGFSEAQNDEGYLKNILQSQKLLKEKIIPASTSLNEANFNHLMSQYDSFKETFSIEKFLVNFLMIGLFVYIIGFQYYLFRKTNRILNIPMLFSSLLIICFTVYLNSVFSSTSTSLKVAKEDAFDSVHALSKAKAIAYDANAIESLYLLASGDTDLQSKLTVDFNNDVNLLTDVAIKNVSEFVTNHQKFGGLLGDELANITFDGEEKSAIETVENFVNYVIIDKQIRNLESSSQHAQAVVLNLGENQGQSNWAFSKFDKSLDNTIKINQEQFDRNIEICLNDVSYLNVVTIIVFMLIAGGIVLGTKQRVDEYSF